MVSSLAIPAIRIKAMTQPGEVGILSSATAPNVRITGIRLIIKQIIPERID